VPFTAAGRIDPGLHVWFRTTADCGGALSTSRSTAFRCFLDQDEPGGGNIEDPCFADPHHGPTRTVVCPDAISTNQVVVLRSHRVLRISHHPQVAYSGISPDPDVWMLRLANGDECRWATGAVGFVGHTRINYGCGLGAAVGLPDRRGRVWTIGYLYSNSRTPRPMAVVTAWA
jgi:hypothetical protein